ncbi:MAG: serine/threonine-protein kinase [Gemmatimonadota bacterium]
MSDPIERLRRIRDLFDALMDRPPDEREDYLAAIPDCDAEMRRELAALIAADGRTGPELELPHVRESRSQEHATLVGQRLGAYEVVRLIGMGGMGAVYEAVRADDQYRKRVAIKLVQGGLDSGLAVARFRRERQILASLEHPNIATLLDGGITPDGRPFLVMEFVEGEPITSWCDTHLVPLRERLALFRQVCGAVHHAHQKLVIHRDLKPGNILVGADGSVKLLDFGIAKLLGSDTGDEALPLTRGGARTFTPEYASPEQIRGDALSTASDIYALGVVLFELLTGRRPHVVPGHSLVAIERAVLEDPIPRPGAVATEGAATASGERSVTRLRHKLAGDLDSITLKALSQEPQRRYASAEALGEDINRHLRGFPVLAQRGWGGYRFRKFVRRNAAAVSLAALVLVALIGGFIATTAEARRARSAQTRAERVNDFLRVLLSSVQPTTGGRDVPVSEILDAAARRVDLELASQPEVRAELETVIGQSYMTLGRYEEAERHVRNVLAIRQQLTPRSPLVVAALNDLGGVFLGTGENDQADSIFKSGLALEDSIASGPDTLLASLLDNRGSVEHARGQPAEAERLHRQALTIRRSLLGDHSDKVAFSMNNVAVSLGEQNNWAAAESLHRAAIAILKTNHPEPSTMVADAEDALATALDLQGKNAAAESTYVEVIALRRSLLGPQHPMYAWTLSNYAMFVFDQGRYREAADLSEQILALRGKTLPESHPMIAAALQTVGRARDKANDRKGAAEALEESLALRRRYLPAGSWLIASSEGILAEHYTLVGDYPRAETLLLDANAINLHSLGADNPRTIANTRRIVTLYQAWKRPDKVREFQAKLPAPAP